MANKRITDFSELTELSAEDYLLVASGESTYKAKVKSLPGGGLSSEEIEALNASINNAQTTANEAKTTAEAAQTTANEAKEAAQKGGGSGYFKKVYSGTLTQAQKSFEFHTFADGTPLKFTEIYVRGAAVTNLSGTQALNIYYGWTNDGSFNAYKTIGMIPFFCQATGTDISAKEFSMKSELFGTRIFNQYGYATSGGVNKSENKVSEVDVFTQLSFWSGGAGIVQPGSWFEVYAR